MNIYAYVITGMSASFLLCVGMFLFYLKYRKNLLQQQYQIKVAEVAHQKALLHTVITSQEQERKRIGMDLHDEVGSALSSLRLMLENFTEQQAKPETATHFKVSYKQVIDGIITNVRHISHNLSPLLKGAYGFYDALEDFCDGINRSGKIQITLDLQQGSADVQLNDASSLALYRVLTELVNNTLKHAGATLINLRFSVEQGQYIIDYKDNGKGLPPDVAAKGKGMGFSNIESRLDMIGAAYVLKNEGGFGIRVTLPLN